MDRASQQQTVAVNRGLFLVRYAAAKDKLRPPTVKVSADPASNKNISFFLNPDENEPVLSQPETCLVVRATTAGKLAVQVVPARKGGSTAATIRIESLNQSKAASSLAHPKREGGAPNLNDIRILGHVTGIGDVVVGANEWLAGPEAPSRIEGLSLDWLEKPSDLEIRYAVETARPQPISGQAVELGTFAGTRGKAMPIVGVMLELSGRAAANLQFAVEAIFLGAPTKRLKGKRIVAAGPTGREPLVGLRLCLKGELPTRTSCNPAEKKPGRTVARARATRQPLKSSQQQAKT